MAIAISVVLLLIAALFVLRGVLEGRRYVWVFSAAKSVSVILSVILGTLLAAGLSWLTAGLILGGLINSGLLGSMETLFSELPSLEDLFRGVVSMILAPLFFYLTYPICKMILFRVSVPVTRLILKSGKTADAEVAEKAEETSAEEKEGTEKKKAPKVRRKDKKRTDLLMQGRKNPIGMLCGALCGFLMFVAILIPVVGTLDLANGIVNVVMLTEDDDDLREIGKVTDALADNAGAKVVKVCGGGAAYSAMTTYPVGEHRVSLHKELSFFAATGKAMLALENKAVSDREAANALRNAAEAFEKTSLIPTLAPELLSAAGEHWAAGESFHGMTKFSLGGNLAPVSDSIMDILAGSTYETVKEDVHTIMDILARAVEKGAFRGDSDDTAFLEDPAVMEDIFVELLENPHMSSMVGGILEHGLKSVAEEIGANMRGGKGEIASMDQFRLHPLEVTDPAHEAKVLSNVFVALGEMTDIEDSKGLVSGIRALGKMMDSLSESEMVGEENVKILLTCILQAEELRENIGFSLQEATDLANTMVRDRETRNEDGSVNTYEGMMGSIASVIQIVESSAKNDSFEETVSSLMADLTPVSAELLSQLVSSSVMERQGISGQSAHASSELISNLFLNLADARPNMDESVYLQETDAVMDLMNLTTRSNQSGQRVFGTYGATGIGADQFVDNIVTSTVVSATMTEFVFAEGATEPVLDPLYQEEPLDEEDAEDLGEAMNDSWNELSAAERSDPNVQKNYVALGAMFGMEVELSTNQLTLTQPEA